MYYAFESRLLASLRGPLASHPCTLTAQQTRKEAATLRIIEFFLLHGLRWLTLI